MPPQTAASKQVRTRDKSLPKKAHTHSEREREREIEGERVHLEGKRQSCRVRNPEDVKSEGAR
jgi:hypothetical protein